MSGAYVQFSDEVRADGGNLLFAEDRPLPLCATIGDDVILVYVEGATFGDAHIGLAGGVHSQTGELTVDFDDEYTYRILFQERSYIAEKLKYSLEAGGEFRIGRNKALYSVNSSQTDLSTYWGRINISSSDLGPKAERDYIAETRLPVISSFILPAQFRASCLPDGTMSSFSSQPYGEIAFVESGIRKYHQLIGDYS